MKHALGMYSPELRRDTVERLFDAARIYGFREIQFDFSSVCTESMPHSIDPALVRRIKKAADDRGLVIRAVNGTFNMIHPDQTVVEDGIARFEQIAAACPGLGCRIVTLCTGTRCRDHMWRWDNANEDPCAWQDLLATTARLISIAEKYDLVLGIETEASNVVNTPQKALALIEHFKGDRLKIIFDPANLFHPGDARPENALRVVEEAFSILKDHIILAHGKDIHAGDGIDFTSAGQGIVPFERFLALLDTIGYTGAIITHGIHEESDFPFTAAFMNEIMK